MKEQTVRELVSDALKEIDVLPQRKRQLIALIPEDAIVERLDNQLFADGIKGIVVEITDINWINKEISGYEWKTEEAKNKYEENKIKLIALKKRKLELEGESNDDR